MCCADVVWDCDKCCKRDWHSNATGEAVTGSTREAGAGDLQELCVLSPEKWSAAVSAACSWAGMDACLHCMLSGMGDQFNAPTT